MNIFEALHLDKNDPERYAKIVKALGEKEIYDCLPFDKKEISKAIKTDPNLNNLPLKRWEAAAGFYMSGNDCQIIGSHLIHLMKAKGVTLFTCADSVCILKEAAKMLVS